MMLGTIARLTPPPDPVRWQCVVAELAAILGVEPEAFAVVWCDLALNPGLAGSCAAAAALRGRGPRRDGSAQTTARDRCVRRGRAPQLGSQLVGSSTAAPWYGAAVGLLAPVSLGGEASGGPQ